MNELKPCPFCCIDNAPTIGVSQVVRGAWKLHRTDREEYEYCSVCENTLQESIYVSRNYCSDCGANMKEEGEYGNGNLGSVCKRFRTGDGDLLGGVHDDRSFPKPIENLADDAPVYRKKENGETE